MSHRIRDLAHPPGRGKKVAFSFPEVQSRSLRSGVQVHAVYVPDSPIVNAKILVPGGGQYNPITRPGLANVVGVLLHKGTKDIPGDDLLRKVENYGCSLQSGASWEYGFIEARMLATHLYPCLDWMVQCVQQPALDEKDWRRTVEHHYSHAARRCTFPQTVAEDAFNLLVYQSSPYAYPLAGTPESLKKLEHTEVIDFHRKFSNPRGTALVIVGGIEPAQLMDRADSLLKTWSSEPSKPVSPPAIEPSWTDSRLICIVDMPRAKQACLVIGHAGLPLSHPDYLSLSFLNSLLGSGLTSRLSRCLREKHGLTYQVQSNLARRQGPGPFTVSLAVENSSVGLAVSEILAQLKSLIEVPVSAAELQTARSQSLRTLAFDCQTHTSTSKRIEQLAISNLPMDYFRLIESQYASLEPRLLREVAGRHLHPSRAVIVAVGPTEPLQSQLEPLGRIVTIDAKDLSQLDAPQSPVCS